MDFDSFLASPRWEILQILAENPSSPIELASKLNTTVSYVSQQLKLLDAAGIVVKKKTGASQRGKPRSIFSLSNELLYLTVLTNEFSNKKLLRLTVNHKAIIKIWMIDDVSLHQPIQQIFWKLQENIKDVEGIFLDLSKNEPKVLVLCDSKQIKAGLEAFQKRISSVVECLFISKVQLNKFSLGEIVGLHDPFMLTKNLKGGELKKDE
ncbi:winged helix-turn-helix transcriptional regulator [Candidatus Pacearchaeota archaeon]|nr:winged helix-turn-helix transcriptional regulator [Candidatus Pacearchaeota archaeon]